MRRWLIVSAQHHPVHGGIGTYVTQFARAAKLAGWSVDLLTRPGIGYPDVHQVFPIVTADCDPRFEERIGRLRALQLIRPYRYMLWSRAVARQLSCMKASYDAVEFVDCQAEGLVSLCSAQVRSHWAGVPMLVHAHTPMFVEEEINRVDLNAFGRGYYHAWEREALLSSDWNIATSSILANRLPAPERTTVIPYPFAGTSRPILRYKDREPLVMYVGSIQPRKGADVWARSLGRVLDTNSDVRAIMIGPDTMTGPDGGSMMSHIMNVLPPRHRDRCRWLGTLSHERTIDIIRRALVVIVPSRFDSFSFAACEAIDCGTPVLLSDMVGLREHLPEIPRFADGDVNECALRQIELLENWQKASIQIAQLREQMLSMFSPFAHIAARERLLSNIGSQVGLRPSPTTHQDAMEAADEFIASVESQEASASVCSSAVS
jgi:glycosyltransferase involved in cell wall biosynthesis